MTEHARSSGARGREPCFEFSTGVTDVGGYADKPAQPPILPARSSAPLHVVVTAVIAVGILLTVLGAPSTVYGAPPPWIWLVVLTIGSTIAQLFPIFVPHGAEGEDVNVEEVVWAAMFLILPAGGVVIALGASCIAAQVVRRRRPIKLLFNLASQLAGCAVGLAVLDVIAGPAGSPTSSWQLVGVGVAVITCSSIMSLSVMLVIAAATGQRFVTLVNGAFSFVALPLVASWGLVAAVAVRDVPWLLVPAAAPVVLLWGLQRASINDRRLRRLLDAAQRMAVAVTHDRVIAAIETATSEILGATHTDIVSHDPGPDATCSEIPTSHARQWLVIRRHPNASRWRNTDQEALDTVAAMAGTALDNAQLLREIREQAEHDPLTRLPNWIVLKRVLDAAVTIGSAGVLVIDVDRFKRVNDNLGHDVGDAVATAVALRIVDIVDGRGVVCRLGGDEFAVITDGLGSTSLNELADTILEGMRRPTHAAGHELHLTVSIGSADQTADRASSRTLLRSAGVAADSAKAAGRDRIERASDIANDEGLDLEIELRSAIARGQLRVVYQPVLDTAGRIESAEALVRWTHPQLGMIPPDRFLPVAEQLGLVPLIDMHVLDKAVRQVRAWADDGINVRVAVNMSASTLARSGVVEQVMSVLTHRQVAATSLEIEVTEQISTHEPEAMIERLRQLRGHGVTIAIDDFGTGFSSLSRLQTFPVDRIKIDRSFLKPKTFGHDPMPIVSATIAIAHGLGLQVTAEGVERADQLSYLQERGCDSVQGFLFSPGVTATAFAELCHQRSMLRDGHQRVMARR